MNVLIRPCIPLLSALLCLSATAPAQQPAPSTAEPVAAVPADTAVAAFKSLDAWVRACEVPLDAKPPEGLGRLGGCSITLRLDHHVIGRAFDFAGGPDALLRVARAAIAQAVPHLPVGHDATAAQQLRDAAARITISLELAGTLIPTRFSTFADADASLQPGLEGIAARFGDKIAGAFPAAMLVMNKTPGESLAAAVSEASATFAIPGSPKNEAGAIAAENNGTYYRFRVMHLVQTREGQAPEFLFRGGRIVRPEQIDTKALRSFAASLAQNLEARVGQDGTLAGTLLPALGRSLPETAGPLEQAIAAAALTLYVEQLGLQHRAAQGLDRLEAVKNPPEWAALEAASRLLAASSKDATVDPVVASAWTLAATAARRVDSDRLRTDPVLLARVLACVASAYDPQTGWLKDIKPSERSLITLALALESAEPGAPTDHRARAESAVRAVFVDTPPNNLISQMPWLGQAEVALAGDKGPMPAAPALRDMRDLVWKYQLTPDDAGAEGEDLVGGIVFTTSRNPLPTWLSVRPVIFLAQAARDPRLTDQDNPKEKLAEVSHLLSAMRFLRQLMIDDASAYSAEDPSAAIGGIRSSLWDQRQPVDATALTLMAVCEVLRTLTPNP